MIKLNETEEIISLISKGFDLELLSFELDIPLEKLEELKVQMSKRKNCNLRKKEYKNIKEQQTEKDKQKEIQDEITKPDYEKIINRYKAEIVSKPQKALQTRNLLAFAYSRAGRIDEARDELISLIKETGSYMAYRQLVHLEKKEGNLDDAKLWAYEALDKFSDSIAVREQLISIAREEKDVQEVIRQLKDIIDIDKGNEKNKIRLKTIIDEEER